MGKAMNFPAQSRQNRKFRFLGLILFATLFIPIPSYPAIGFSAAGLENLDQNIGSCRNCQGQLDSALVAFNNTPIIQAAFTTFLPVVIRNPLPPPGGVWDTSTWDNCYWGN